MEDVAALRSDAVDVIAYFAEAAVLEGADLVLHELLEAVPGELFVFDVVRLVFLWKIGQVCFGGSAEVQN